MLQAAIIAVVFGGATLLAPSSPAFILDAFNNKNNDETRSVQTAKAQDRKSVV